MENRYAPIHRWVPWIAGFSGQFVEDVFREFLSDKKLPRRPVILDPFAGVGTTLVQAMLNGHEAIGFEINPYAALATRMKVKAARICPSKISQLIDTVTASSLKWNDNTPPTTKYRPTEFRSRIPFFSARIEPQILRLLELVETYPDKDISDVGRLALGSVLVKVSNYTYEPSLSSRPGAGKPLLDDADVPGVLNKKLEDILEDVQWLKFNGVGGEPDVRREIHTKDFLSVNGELPNQSVDLMITSPPYMNNYHYVRNTRPQLFWLALVSSVRDLQSLEQTNFGKYWQTVRDIDPIPLTCRHAGLKETIETLKGTRTSAKAYGGPGWANYVTTYFNDCDRFMKVLKRVMRRGAFGVVVIGNSIIQGINIPTDRIMGDLAQDNGLRLEGITKLREKRVGASITSSSIRRGEKNSSALYESVVILRRS